MSPFLVYLQYHASCLSHLFCCFFPLHVIISVLGLSATSYFQEFGGIINKDHLNASYSQIPIHYPGFPLQLRIHKANCLLVLKLRKWSPKPQSMVTFELKEQCSPVWPSHNHLISSLPQCRWGLQPKCPSVHPRGKQLAWTHIGQERFAIRCRRDSRSSCPGSQACHGSSERLESFCAW